MCVTYLHLVRGGLLAEVDSVTFNYPFAFLSVGQQLLLGREAHDLLRLRQRQRLVSLLAARPDLVPGLFTSDESRLSQPPPQSYKALKREGEREREGEGEGEREE